MAGLTLKNTLKKKSPIGNSHGSEMNLFIPNTYENTFCVKQLIQIPVRMKVLWKAGGSASSLTLCPVGLYQHLQLLAELLEAKW